MEDVGLGLRLEAEAQPVFVVEGVAEVFPERAEVFPELRGPEAGLLRDGVADEPIGCAADRAGQLRPLAAVDFEGHCPAEDPRVARGVRFGDRGERAGVEEVVAVDVAVDVAGGVRKTLVDRVALAVVLFADPPREAVGVFADDGGAAVGAAAVDDDVFEVRVVLV